MKGRIMERLVFGEMYFLRTLIVVTVLIVLSFIIPEYVTNYLTVWILFGLLALSLDLVWGFGGIFSFGQTAFFGVGGYIYGIIAINLESKTGETTLALIGGLLIGALLASILGYFLFYGRINDIYLSIITLAVPLVFLTIVSSTADRKFAVGKALLGGYNGMIGIPPIMLGIPHLFSVSLGIQGTYVFVVLISGAIFLGIKHLLKRPFGRVLIAVRENELRTELLGYDIRLIKLIVFTIAGAIAGLAGAVYAAWGMFINPSVFDLPQAARVVIYLLVGGQGTLIGSFIGSIIVGGISTLLGSVISNQTIFILGLIFILFVLFIPNGIVPMIKSLFLRFAPKYWFASQYGPNILTSKRVESPVNGPSSLAEVKTTQNIQPVLRLEGVSKQFGGVAAVNDVSVDFSANGVYCLIGPNGAGKSTLFNLIIGRYRQETGKLRFKGEEITVLQPHQRVRRGMGIKLQVSSVYNRLTVYENLWLAAHGKEKDVSLHDRLIGEVLFDMGLYERAMEPAGHLSHGEQQRLEIGMVLIAKPSLILLDEPTAGMTREETSKVAEYVRELGQYGTVIVVEHDIEFVRQLQAPVIVFHQGQVFKIGHIEDLRNDEAILNIYLGRRSDVTT